MTAPVLTLARYLALFISTVALLVVCACGFMAWDRKSIALAWFALAGLGAFLNSAVLLAVLQIESHLRPKS